MKFEKPKESYYIIDYSFFIYNGSYGRKMPCKCARNNTAGKLEATDPECPRCDGKAWAFMSNVAGYRTGGLHEVFNQILKAIDQDFRPVLVFDPPKENLDRTGLLDSYKGNRKECPDWIHAQMCWGEEHLQYIRGVDCYTSDTDESDDVIATLALEWADKGHKVVIAADDKDFFPCLDHKNITMWRQKAAFTKQSFINKFGFEPNRFTDYLAIVGDSADNYNLIKGLGPAAATDIIKSYKNLDDMVKDKWSKVTPRTKAGINKIVTEIGIEKFKEELTRSLQLAQLNLKTNYRKLEPDPDKKLIENYLKEFSMQIALQNLHLLFEEY